MFLILVLRFPRRDWWHLYPKSHVLKCHTARQSSGSRTKTTDPNLSIKYRPVRETWLLPFQLQSFRKSILLSIIHRSAYKQVAELTQQNLCILLTYIQEFTSHGGKIPTKPNCRRNTVTDCSECKKKSIGAKCAVLWWRSEPREAGGLFSTAEQWEVADPSLPRDFSKWHKVLAICAPTDCAPLYSPRAESHLSFLVHFKLPRMKAWVKQSCGILPKGAFQLQSLYTSPERLWICCLKPCAPIKKSESWKPKKFNACRTLEI